MRTVQGEEYLEIWNWSVELLGWDIDLIESHITHDQLAFTLQNDWTPSFCTILVF